MAYVSVAKADGQESKFGFKCSMCFNSIGVLGLSGFWGFLTIYAEAGPWGPAALLPKL